jgi:hypothetical protein
MVSVATAGSMPELPELPPLPTTYEAVRDGGFYAGVLGGYTFSGFGAPTLGAVFGHVFHSSGVILGSEGNVQVSKGIASIDGGLRGGIPLSDKLSAHTYLGVGYSVTTHAYGAVGFGAEFILSADLAARLDYRNQHDFSGDAPVHAIMAGLVRNF